MPEGRSLNILLRSCGGHSSVPLAVLTTCRCLAVTGPSKFGHGTPGSHITEMFWRQAGHLLSWAVTDPFADVRRELLRASSPKELSCNSAGVRHRQWCVSFASARPVTGGMRHYKSSVLQKTGQKSVFQPTTSKPQLIKVPASTWSALDALSHNYMIGYWLVFFSSRKYPCSFFSMSTDRGLQVTGRWSGWMVHKHLDSGMWSGLGHKATLVNVPGKKKKYIVNEILIYAVSTILQLATYAMSCCNVTVPLWIYLQTSCIKKL